MMFIDPVNFQSGKEKKQYWFKKKERVLQRH